MKIRSLWNKTSLAPKEAKRRMRQKERVRKRSRTKSRGMTFEKEEEGKRRTHKA